MAISYIGNALGGTATTTSFSITLPTTQANDIIVLEYAHRGPFGATIGGTFGLSFGLVKNQSFGADFSGRTHWARATGNHSGQTITGTGLTNSCAAIVTIYRGAISTSYPFNDATIVGEQNASGDETQAGITTATAGAYVVLVVANSPDVAVTSVTATSPAALTNRAELLSTGGTDASIVHASAEKATAGATGSFSWAQTNGASGSWAYAIKPEPTSPTVALNTPDATEFATDTTPTLEFTGTDPQSDDIRYNVQIDDANDFVTPLLDKTSGTDSGFVNTVNGGDTDPFTSGQKVSYTVQAGDALATGNYYWRVRGIDPAGSNTYGTWSATRTFSVGLTSTTTTQNQQGRSTISPAPPVPSNFSTAASGDDAHQTIATGAVDITYTGDDPYATNNAGSFNGLNHVGFRFPSVTIAQGTTISSAVIKIKGRDYSGDVSLPGLTVYAQNSDTAAAFTTTASDISARARTTANVAGTSIAATNTAIEINGITITSLVQEVLNRAGWASGNAMAMLFIGSGTVTTQYYKPYFWDYFTGTFVATITITLPASTVPFKRFQYGVANIAAGSGDITTTQNQTGVARIEVTVTRDQTGKGRITVTVTRDQTGLSRITSTVPRTQTGVSRITATLVQTQTGISRIQKSVIADITGVSRITVSTARNQDGVANIVAAPTTTTRDQLGKAAVLKTVEAPVTGVSRITITSQASQNGVARIVQTFLQNITGTSRITATATRDQLGKAAVLNAILHTILGTSRITVTVTRTTTGTARITVTNLAPVTGTTRIEITTTRGQLGLTRIQTVVLRVQDGTARIALVSNRDQNGISRITSVSQRDALGQARIQTTSLQTITGLGRIAYVTSQDVTGTSRVQAVVDRAQTGASRVQAVVNRDQTGVAKITSFTKLHTLYDDFNDNSLDTSKWTLSASNSSESNQRITFSLPDVDFAYADIMANDSYDLTSSHVFLETVNVTSNQYEFNLMLFDNISQSYYIAVFNNTLQAFHEGVSIGSVAWNATTHKWWKISETGGTMYYQTSPDGVTWTTLASAAPTVAITALFVFVSATLQPAGTAQTFGFDNFNIIYHDRLQLGTSAIRRTTDRTQTGVSRILRSEQQAQTGVSRITKSADQLQTGTSRVTTTGGQAQTGVSKIIVVHTDDQTGQSRIQITITRDQPGTGNIYGTTTRDQPGSFVMAGIWFRQISGLSRVARLETKPQTGQSLIVQPILVGEQASGVYPAALPIDVGALEDAVDAIIDYYLGGDVTTGNWTADQEDDIGSWNTP